MVDVVLVALHLACPTAAGEKRYDPAASGGTIPGPMPKKIADALIPVDFTS